MKGPTLFAYALLCIAALAWAGNFIVGRYIHEQVTPITLSYSRALLALVILSPFTFRAILKNRGLLQSNVRIFVLLGLTGMALFHTTLYAALESTGAINAALIMSITPVVIVALSWGLDRESITWIQGIGIGISLAGALVIIIRGEISTLITLDFNRGDLWMLVAMPNWALYSVLLRRVPGSVDPLVALTTIIAMGVALMTPVFIFELVRGPDFLFTRESILGVLYVALFASIVAYICWNRGVSIVGANRAGLFMHLVPAFSAVLAILILKEPLGGYHVAGILLILFGIYLTTSTSTQESG